MEGRDLAVTRWREIADGDAAGRAYDLLALRSDVRVLDQTMTRLHARARALSRAVASARAVGWSQPTSCRHDLDLARALADGMIADLRQLRIPNEILDDALRELTGAVERAARELVQSLVMTNTALGRVGDLSKSFDRACDLTAELGLACVHTGHLRRSLECLPVDAARADLSELNACQLAAIDGVLWTDETCWPPGALARIRRRSREVGPGVYRVTPAVGVNLES